MAVGALPRRHGVCAGQGEIHHRVIERSRRPRNRGVALLASLRKVCGDVIGIRRALKIFQMARDASGSREVVVIVAVAVGALSRRHHVAPGQREADRRMVEFGVRPSIGSVALLAGNRKFAGDVIGIDSVLEVGSMTRITLRGHRLKLAVGGILMAGLTINRRVRPSQRETIIVLLNLLDRNRPAAHRMALLAIRAQLPLVNVGMAVLAALPNICEYELDVALHASDGLVHAAQRISRLIVIELRHGADGPPRISGVAVLARHIQIAMRTVRTCGLRSRLLRKYKRHQQQHRG